MRMQLVERSQGLSREEVAGRLSNGWLCIPNIAVPGSGLVVPGQPEVGKTVDAWMPPPFRAMMPQLAVVQALVIVADKGGDIITLDDLAKLWFNKPLRTLIESMQQPEQEQAEDAE